MSIQDKKLKNLDRLYRFNDCIIGGTFIMIAILSAATILAKVNVTLIGIIAFVLNIILYIANGVLSTKYKIETQELYKYKHEDFIEAGIMGIICLILLVIGWI